jgi:hypothetical protein
MDRLSLDDLVLALREFHGPLRLAMSQVASHLEVAAEDAISLMMRKGPYQRQGAETQSHSWGSVMVGDEEANTLGANSQLCTVRGEAASREGERGESISNYNLALKVLM